MVLTAMTEIMVPKFTQWAIDCLDGESIPAFFSGTDKSEQLNIICAGLVFTLFIAWLGRILWRQFLGRQTHHSGNRMQIRLWDSLRYQPSKVFQKYSLGDLMNRATGDWNSARFIHGFTIVLTSDLVFLTIFGSVAMFLIDPLLTVYCLAIFPFLPKIITKLAKREHTQHTFAQEKLSDLSDLISGSLSSIRMQRATDSHGMWHRALSEEALEYSNRRYEVIKTGWKIFPLGALPTIVAYGVLIFLGVGRIKTGALSLGEFVAMLQYVLLLQIPLFEIGDCISEWQKGFASLTRIVEIFSLRKPLKKGTADLTKASASKTTISVNKLNFSFDSERQILKNISFTVSKGEHIGLTGSIGTGKTTLVNLISGLQQSRSGEVAIMGQPINDYNPKDLTNIMTIVPQRSFLFAGSLRYNLNLDREYDDQELWRVLDLVQLSKDVAGFKDGLETWIGEWGITLSGGQKQRLALARALLRADTILLLDDCLSAVDAATEEKILLAMSRELSDLTVVWVAHRQSTLRLCKRIYEITDGTMNKIDHEVVELDKNKIEGGLHVSTNSNNLSK
jgi:ATP-binding cassette, subfamily B, multidrug efflux pump